MEEHIRKQKKEGRQKWFDEKCKMDLDQKKTHRKTQKKNLVNERKLQKVQLQSIKKYQNKK